jgi:predicted permease
VSLLVELRLALRRLGRRPALSLLAVGLLAAGLAGNFALLGVLDAILFRQPPVAEPERLVRVVRTDAERSTYDNWSYPTADDLRRGATSFTDAAILADWRRFHVKVEGGESVRVQGSVVTANYFELLGVRPALGRLLAPADDADGGAPVVVLSHDAWRTLFGADPGVVGRDVRLNGERLTVVGVAPRGLASLDPTMAPALWVPMATWDARLDPGERELMTSRGSSWLDLVARLAPGVALEQAQAELDTRLAQLAQQFPDSLMVETRDGQEPARSWVMAHSDARVGGPVERPRVERQAAMVGGVGALVLLAVAANLAALLAARAAQTRHETAVRAALGASRARLVAPLLAEGVLLVAAGVTLAIPLAGAAFRLAQRSLDFVLTLAGEPTLDLLASPRLLAAAAILVTLAVALVGALPGLAGSRLDLVPALRRESSAGRRRRLAAGDLLVVAQVAVSVALLAAAALLVGRFRELAATDDGIDAESVVQLWYDTGLQDYSEERARGFHAELLRRAEAALGGAPVALSDWTPLEGGWSRTSIVPDGYQAAPGEIPNADVSEVTPRLAEVLGLRLRAGRWLAESDVAESQRVAVVNETMARRYFPGRDAVGASFRYGADDPPITVVGVVADARYRDLDREIPAMFFLPLAQGSRAAQPLALVARAAQPAAALAALRGVVRSLDAELPVFRDGRLAEQAREALRPERTAAALFSGFATLVLVLATAGLAALALASVARRRREIGVRVALGARPGEVVRLMLSRLAWLLGAGAGLGLAGTLALAPALADVAGAPVSLSPLPVAATLAVLAVAATAATWIPARRALAIDPAEALRSE